MSKRSDRTEGPSRAPRLSVETGPIDGGEGPVEAPDRPVPLITDAELQGAVGFIRGVGAMAWRFAAGHPYTVAYGFTGLVLAVLILVVGLWDTIVIAVFVVVGAMIGQIRDGDNGMVKFFSRLFSGRG